MTDIVTNREDTNSLTFKFQNSDRINSTRLFIASKEAGNNNEYAAKLILNSHLQVIETPIAPELIRPDNYAGSTGVAVNITIQNSGGTLDTCSISPNLPTGLSISKLDNNCLISGSFNQVHHQSYTVTAANESGSLHTAAFSIQLTQPLALPEIELPGSRNIFGLNTLILRPEEAIELNFINNGGAISECQVEPKLPQGLSLQLNDDACKIIGQSTLEVPVQTYQVTAENTQGKHSAEVRFKIEVLLLTPRIDDKTISIIEQENLELVLENRASNSQIDSCSGDLPFGLTLRASDNSCIISGSAKIPAAKKRYLITAENRKSSYTAELRITVTQQQIDLLTEIENAEKSNVNTSAHASAPLNVSASYDSNKGVVILSWLKPEATLVNNYKVEYGCSAGNAQLAVSSLDIDLNTSVEVAQNIGEKCIYIISTIDKELNKYSWKTFLNIGPGRFSGPRSLIGQANEKTIKLNWLVPSQIPEALNKFTISGYKIYRKKASESMYKEIAITNSSLSYTDTTAISGTNYAYKVVALITNVNTSTQEESRASNETDILSLEILSSVPQATQLRAEQLDGQIVIDWKNPTIGKDIASDILITGFQVYRKLGSDKDYSLLFTNNDSNKTFFIDDTALPGLEYFYQVTVLALKQGDGSVVEEKQSEPVKLTPFVLTANLPIANILSDANRDGYLNVEDNFDEAVWTTDSGAVFGPNLDDDDGDGEQDGHDNQPNGEQDLGDMAKVILKQMPQLLPDDEVTLDISYDVTILANRNAIFKNDSHRDQEPWVFLYNNDDSYAYDFSASSWTVLNDRNEYPVSGNTISAELSESDLLNGDIIVYVDSLYGRHPGFDGNVKLTLKVQREGVIISEDSVALKGAPVLYSHTMQQARRVFITDKGWKPVIPLYDAIEARLDTSVTMAGQEEPSYWAQDAGQFSYSQRPGKNGLQTTFVHTRLPSGTVDWFGHTDQNNSLINFAQLGSDKINAGGNIEVIPPYSHNGIDYPFGRIIVGGSIDPSLPVHSSADKSRDLLAPIMNFFTSQDIQGPPIVVPSAWLTIGHIDEIFKFLPNLNAKPGERPWVVAIAAPEKALELEDKEHEYNLNVQKYVIDEIKKVFKEEIGLTDEDFIELPLLYARNGGSEYSSVINMQVVGDELYVPKPFADKVDGVDPFEQATREALEALGYNVHFISILDTYFSSGNGGGIHCGTNVEFYPVTDVPWWTSNR